MKLIIDLAKKSDFFATATLHETARYLGLGMAPIIYGLGPQAIVIGGAIARAWPWVQEEIWKACSQRVTQPFLKNTTLLPSTMHTRASLMGAISLVLAQNFAAPEIFAAA